MRFSINLRTPDLSRLEEEARILAQDVAREAEAGWARLQAELPRLEQQIRTGFEQARPPEGFEAAFQAELQRVGLGDLGGVNIGNLDDLAELAARLPPDLAAPPARAELPPVAADIPRETAAVAASLSAAPRIVEWLGADAVAVELRGLTFTIEDTYRDPLTGFLGLRLSSEAFGDVFAVDGLIVGSRADEVTALTLGRLQVGSAEFARMVADAAEAAAGDVPVTFAGPSLGGAIAQAAAHETARALVAGGNVEAGPLQLVTVDALGGRDAAEWIAGGVLDPAALSLLTALNLRTEGDIIPQLGAHVGEVLTLPALDAAGNRVELAPSEAHVNVVSLLQVLGDDALFAQGVLGDPGEIGGFARASALVSDELIAAWLRFGAPESPPSELQVPGPAGFDPTGTVWSLDANGDGAVDIAVRLATPQDTLIG